MTLNKDNFSVSKPKALVSSPRNHFFSIANQLRFGFVFFVILSLLPTGGVLISLSFQSQLQQSQLLQQERSKAAAGQIENYLDDLKRKLSYLARVRGLTSFSPQAQQSLLEGLTRHNDAYEAVAIVDRKGQVVAAVSPYEQVKWENVENSSLFLRAFKQQEDYISPVEINSTTHLPSTTLAVPIRNQQDEVDGVLLARINLNFLWFVVSQTEVGKTGYVYITDERNYLIARKGSTAEKFQLQDLSNRPFIQKLNASADATQLNVYQGLAGVEVLAATSAIHSVSWNVVVELPTAEAYASVRQMLFVMGGVLVIVTVAAAGVGLMLSRSIVLPLQHLTTAATQISDGDLNTEVNVPSHNELGALAKTFNKMTAQLRDLIEAVEIERNFVSAILEIAGALVVVLDAQGRIVRFNRACEQITHYSFNEVKDQYFRDIFLVSELREETKFNFQELQSNHFPNQYESYLTTKEGEQRLIAWSNTALLDDEGMIEYIISTGIDITERKRVEEDMQQAKEEAEVALQSFRQAQSQLIQAEKMSSLGQMVAGVAHEINNPVNFIYGNLTHTQEYAQDLLSLIYLYQQHYPDPHPEILEQAEEIELEFLSEDLPKILSSMRLGADRIRQIVLSLRNFSRLDEADMKPVDIHEGIDSTLLILQNRLKAKPEYPAKEVSKEYGNLPLIECYAGQLNQVFMNILSNAIDALDTYNSQRSIEEIRQNPNRITIRTQLSGSKHAIIRIADNGPGMTEDVKIHLFNPFFTTKPVGKGTGLGLSISYQIVVEKHGGSLHCVSEPGKGAEFWIRIPIRQSKLNLLASSDKPDAVSQGVSS